MVAYEFVKKDIGIPLKVSITSIKNYNMHWHRDMEIIMVIKGSVTLHLNNKSYYLKEDDLIIVNSSQPHGLARTEEDNMIVSLKLDMVYHDKYYKNFSKLRFDCKSFLEEDQDKFNYIRKIISQVIVELNEKKRGHSFRIASALYEMAGHLIENFEYEKSEEEVNLDDEDISRMNKVMDYIEANYTKNITLQDIANQIGLSTYYTSHFIKKILGIGFTDYIGNIRLENAALYLVRTSKSITEIALESGYGSAKSFNTNFKNRFKITPSEYRSSARALGDEIYKLVDKHNLEEDDVTGVNLSEALDKIYEYLDLEDRVEPSLKSKDSIDFKLDEEVINISVNTLKSEENIDLNWNEVMVIENTSDCLKSRYQKEIIDLQRELGFVNVKLNRAFTDETIVCQEDGQGDINCNLDKLYEVIDFVLGLGLKPGFELVYDGEKEEYYSNLSFLENLTNKFIKEIVNRYGVDEIKDWYFILLNNPFTEEFYSIKREEEYFLYFLKTYNKFTSLNTNIKIGTEMLYIPTKSTIEYYERFLKFCIREKINLDFISFNRDSRAESFEERINENSNIIDEYYENIKHKTKMKVVLSNMDLKEVKINSITDTSFMAGYILNGLLRRNQAGKFETIIYADVFKSMHVNDDNIALSFGLLSKRGIRTPIYYAYSFLSKLGDRIIENRDNYIVTSKSDEIEILFYNYDKSIERGDIDKDEDYSKSLSYKLKLENLKGNYKIIRYKLNKENGSFHDNWKNLGAPKDLSYEEEEYLRRISIPKMDIEYANTDLVGEITLDVSLPVNGAELIIVKRNII